MTTDQEPADKLLMDEVLRQRALLEQIRTIITKTIDECPNLPKRIDAMTKTEYEIAKIALDAVGALIHVKGLLVE